MSEVGDDGPDDGTPIDRRGFVRRMALDAAVAAGKVQGLSRVVAGSLGVAGQAVVDDLEAIRAREALADAPQAESERPTLVMPDTPEAPRSVTDASPAVVTPEQATILTAARWAVVAVNDRDDGPHVGIVAVHWNGSAIVFAAIGRSRRATLIRSDARLSMTVEGLDDAYLIIRGRASSLSGAAARDALESLLDSVGSSWDVQVAIDTDRLAIIVIPDTVVTARRDPDASPSTSGSDRHALSGPESSEADANGRSPDGARRG